MDIPVRHSPHDGQECPSYIVPGNLCTGAYWPRRSGRAVPTQEPLGTKPWHLPFLPVFALRNGRTPVTFGRTLR